MAFDGITIAAIVEELNSCIKGGRVSKIAQPEKDELIITIKNNSNQYRLFMSAEASLPLIYLTELNKPSPITAPGFCMLLRKYLNNAKITDISQPGLERIIRISFEHLNELGDLCRKLLICEIMGKHSNIILADENEKIIDSIKHISGMVSSVRQVLPGYDYFVPNTLEKKNPLLEIEEEFLEKSKFNNEIVSKALYKEYTGISPLLAFSICENALVNPDADLRSLDENSIKKLWNAFSNCMLLVKQCKFEPGIYYNNDIPEEYSAIPIPAYGKAKTFESISKLLFQYYYEKNAIVKIRQRSNDIRRILQNAIERTAKKLDLQKKQLKDTENREKYRIYGELINAYGYNLPADAKELEVLNYYDNKMVKIPLDSTISPMANAKKYYDKYNKQKRTFEALTNLTKESQNELLHLESIMTSLDIALTEADLVPIKEEMIESGYIKRKANSKKQKITTKPLHYISQDGFHFYVGKNNYQNDELTFKFANSEDWWFHAKNIPGSHVIVKANTGDLPDHIYELAAALAAYYSKAKGQDKVEVDYTIRKNVKKPAAAVPGLVIYHTNYSLIARASLTGLQEIE